MKLLDKHIENLYSDFLLFVEATKYREEENFYTSNYNNIIELSYNENPFGASPKAMEALTYFKDYINLYPPVGYTLLRSTIATGLEINESEIVIGNGSLGIINSAIRLFAEKGDNVVFSKSSIPMYKWAIMSNGSIPVIIPLQGDYNHNLQGLLNAINDKTKVIIVDNPHNPTGLYIEPKTILDFIKKIPETIFVIIDQAYIEYADDYINEAIIKSFNQFPNLLITRTFSKVHALAGLRVGYGISNKKLIEKLWAENLGNVGGVSLLSSFVANAAMKDSIHVHECISKNKTCIDELKEQFKRFYETVLNSSANFICVKTESSKIFLNQIPSNIKVTSGVTFGYDELTRMSMKFVN